MAWTHLDPLRPCTTITLQFVNIVPLPSGDYDGPALELLNVLRLLLKLICDRTCKQTSEESGNISIQVQLTKTVTY